MGTAETEPRRSLTLASSGAPAARFKRQQVSAAEEQGLPTHRKPKAKAIGRGSPWRVRPVRRSRARSSVPAWNRRWEGAPQATGKQSVLPQQASGYQECASAGTATATKSNAVRIGGIRLGWPRPWSGSSAARSRPVLRKFDQVRWNQRRCCAFRGQFSCW